MFNFDEIFQRVLAWFFIAAGLVTMSWSELTKLFAGLGLSFSDLIDIAWSVILRTFFAALIAAVIGYGIKYFRRARSLAKRGRWTSPIEKFAARRRSVATGNSQGSTKFRGMSDREILRYLLMDKLKGNQPSPPPSNRSNPGNREDLPKIDLKF